MPIGNWKMAVYRFFSIPESCSKFKIRSYIGISYSFCFSNSKSKNKNCVRVQPENNKNMCTQRTHTQCIKCKHFKSLIYHVCGDIPDTPIDSSFEKGKFIISPVFFCFLLFCVPFYWCLVCEWCKCCKNGFMG